MKRKTKLCSFILSTLLLISCKSNEIYSSVEKDISLINDVTKKETESLILASKQGNNITKDTKFYNDSIERFDKNNYLTIKVKDSDYHLRIVTNNLEKVSILNKDTVVNENAGLLFVYENKTVPCIKVKDLEVPSEVIFLNSNNVIEKIVRNEENACANKVTPFAIIVPKNFTIINNISLNDKINLE